MLKEALLVGSGGFAGSVARYFISMVMIGAKTTHFLPWGTFAVNGAGSLLIGFFLAVAGEGHWYFLLIAGFCGGFTTFSTFSSELLGMMRGAHYVQAALYIALSVVVCVAAVWMGMLIGEKLK